jgi:hypothetical protein
LLTSLCAKACRGARVFWNPRESDRYRILSQKDTLRPLELRDILLLSQRPFEIVVEVHSIFKQVVFCEAVDVTFAETNKWAVDPFRDGALETFNS